MGGQDGVMKARLLYTSLCAPWHWGKEAKRPAPSPGLASAPVLSVGEQVLRGDLLAGTAAVSMVRAFRVLLQVSRGQWS